jgi:hypothetical protein
MTDLNALAHEIKSSYALVQRYINLVKRYLG